MRRCSCLQQLTQISCRTEAVTCPRSCHSCPTRRTRTRPDCSQERSTSPSHSTECTSDQEPVSSRPGPCCCCTDPSFEPLPFSGCRAHSKHTTTKAKTEPGPLGLRVEHWYDFGEHVGDSNLFVQVVAHIAAAVPHPVLQYLRSGQVTPLAKTTGGHRPLLMMSFLRRLALKSVMAAK